MENAVRSGSYKRIHSGLNVRGVSDRVSGDRHGLDAGGVLAVLHVYAVMQRSGHGKCSRARLIQLIVRDRGAVTATEERDAGARWCLTEIIEDVVVVNDEPAVTSGRCGSRPATLNSRRWQVCPSRAYVVIRDRVVVVTVCRYSVSAEEYNAAAVVCLSRRATGSLEITVSDGVTRRTTNEPDRGRTRSC